MQPSLNSDVTPVLSSDRIILRGWQDSDLNPYTALVSDPVLMHFIGGGAMRCEDARKEFNSMREQWVDRQIGIFAIADKMSDELIGFTGLFESPLIDEPELSWSLSAKNHGIELTSTTKVVEESQ